MNKNEQKRISKLMDRLIAEPGKKISLKDYDADWTGSIKDKKEAALLLADGVKELAKQQDRLYAQDTYSLLMVFQAMDAAGKDGTIRHVMSGINPQGCQVLQLQGALSRGTRSRLSLAIDEGAARARPHRHPQPLLLRGGAGRPRPPRDPRVAAAARTTARADGVWKHRFEQINNFERYLYDNGTLILKFYLNVSKKEQKRRFLERIDQQEKNWKFSVNDAKERSLWKDYMNAYEDVFTHTSTKYAPWYIIPADNKWFMRLAVAAITYRTLDKLNLKYPTLTAEKKQGLTEAKKGPARGKGLIALFQRRRRRPFAPHGDAHRAADDDDGDGADDVVPEEGDVGEGRDPGDRRHSGDQADECAGPGRERDADGEDEDAEDRSVEERSEAIHDLDRASRARPPIRRRGRRRAPQIPVAIFDTVR